MRNVLYTDLGVKRITDLTVIHFETLVSLLLLLIVTQLIKSVLNRPNQTIVFFFLVLASPPEIND